MYFSQNIGKTIVSSTYSLNSSPVTDGLERPFVRTVDGTKSVLADISSEGRLLGYFSPIRPDIVSERTNIVEISIETDYVCRHYRPNSG